MDADGNTLAVGAFGDSQSVSENAVYVFERTDGKWQQQALLESTSTDSLDSFGIAVSLSADGTTLEVGAASDSSTAIGVNSNEDDSDAPFSGAAYVFVRNIDTWQQQAYLKASNTDAYDSFGSAVSVSAYGNTLTVGAISESSAAIGVNGDQSNNTRTNRGVVDLYTFRCHLH